MMTFFVTKICDINFRQLKIILVNFIVILIKLSNCNCEIFIYKKS